MAGRALHFVFKIGDRGATAAFYRDILGMKVLRHEEFTVGCEAQCNGPYANRWSKTMIGYGPEDNHFVAELTYNYGVKSYEKGNDFLGLTIRSSEALQRARAANLPIETQGGKFVLTAPGGYSFILIDKPQPTDRDPVEKVSLASSNLPATIKYWNGLLGLPIIEQSSSIAQFSFGARQATIEFRAIGKPVNHAKAYGRIAFSIPAAQLEGLQKKMEAQKQKILTPLTALPTPGKATVSVVILADPDDHEICFVGDEAFRTLSQVDPESEKELNKFLKSDKSFFDMLNDMKGAI